MPAKFKKSEIIEYRVDIEMDNSDTICVMVRRTCAGSWEVWLPSRIEFTIQQLIEILGAVYDAKIFEEDYDYFFGFEGGKSDKLIRGKNGVMEGVLSQFKISSAKENKE